MTEFKTLENIDCIPHDERKRWHNVGRVCVLAITATFCGIALNLYAADTPSADDAIRATVLTLLGGFFGHFTRTGDKHG